MKILEWNIKGGAAFGWKGKRIDSNLSDELLNYSADVVVLTEFVLIRGIDYLFEKFEENGYIYFTSCCSGKNGILIAIRRELIDCEAFMDSVYKTNLISSHTEGCNILRVELPLRDGGNLVIIGCRMETGYYNDLTAQYDFERLCFNEILIPAIKPLKKDCKYIICGDFNNARCRGNLNIMNNPQDYFDYQNNKRYAQYNFNLNIIKDMLETIGFKMVDKTSDGKPIMTHKKTNKHTGKESWYPDDHIFVNGFNLIEGCRSIPTDKSDHNILLAKVE